MATALLLGNEILLHELNRTFRVAHTNIWEVLLARQVDESARLASADVLDLKCVTVAVKIEQERVVDAGCEYLLRAAHAIPVVCTVVYFPAIGHLCVIVAMRPGRRPASDSQQPTSTALHLPAESTAFHRSDAKDGVPFPLTVCHSLPIFTDADVWVTLPTIKRPRKHWDYQVSGHLFSIDKNVEFEGASCWRTYIKSVRTIVIVGDGCGWPGFIMAWSCTPDRHDITARRQGLSTMVVCLHDNVHGLAPCALSSCA